MRAVTHRGSSLPSCRTGPGPHGTWRAMPASVPQPTGAPDTACRQRRPASPRRCVGCAPYSRVRRQPHGLKDARDHLGSTGRALGTDRPAYHPGGKRALPTRPKPSNSSGLASALTHDMMLKLFRQSVHHLQPEDDAAAQRVPMEPIAERAWGRQHHPHHRRHRTFQRWVGTGSMLAPECGEPWWRGAKSCPHPTWDGRGDDRSPLVSAARPRRQSPPRGMPAGAPSLL